MNFKIFLLIFVLGFAGCGVKAKPLSPPETAIKSYTQSYTGDDTSNEEKKPTSTTPLEKKK